MTRKQKLNAAMKLLREATEAYDKAENLFNSIGVELHAGDRPIELWCGKNELPFKMVYKGIEAIAKINGSEVFAGQPYFAKDSDKYISTVVDGVVISSMEGAK